MKCSTCGFVSDPVNDLCPRCYIDLRDYKRKHFLPVTDATSSYEALLSKKVRIVSSKEKKSAATGRKSWFGTLGGIFAKKTAVESSSHPTITDASQPVAETYQDEEARAEPPRETPGPSPAKLRIGKKEKQALIGSLEKRKAERETPRVTITAPGRVPFSTVGLSADLDSQFEAVERGLPKAAASVINFTELIADSKADEVAVYFDLVQEELRNPEKRRSFVTQPTGPQVSSLDSRELESAVRRYEAAIANPSEQVVRTPKAVTQGRVLAALAADVSLAAVVSLIIALCFYGVQYERAREIMLDDGAIRAVDVTTVALTSLALFVLIYLLALPLFRFLVLQTPGERLAGMRLVRPTGKPIQVTTGFFWNLFSIFDFVFLGLLWVPSRSRRWKERACQAIATGLRPSYQNE